MTYEEFRAEMLAYRRDVDAEASALEDSQLAIERLVDLYLRFDPVERAIALVTVSLLPLLCACSALRSQATRTVVEERYPSGAVLVEGQQKEASPGVWVRDGRWRQLYEDGRLEVEWFFEDGLEHGPWTAFYDDGTVHIAARYHHGREHGSWVERYEDGTKASEGRYVAGEQDGEWRTWHENGVLASVENYALGAPTGTWQEWSESGELMAVHEFGAGGELLSEQRFGPAEPRPSRPRSISAEEARELDAALQDAADER